jgi:crotonobetaine/carnitine-CoA ligase
LEENAREFPERECAVFEDGERWTYKRALEEAYKAANHLSNLGIKRNETVLVFLDNSQHWLRAWWGIASLGAILVPVNTAYKGEMLKHICKDSKARHIITTPDMVERLKNIESDLDIIDPVIFSQGSSEEPKLSEPVEPWDMHSIVYTSGTTGPSKGALLPYFRCYIDTQFYAMNMLSSNDIL